MGFLAPIAALALDLLPDIGAATATAATAAGSIAAADTAGAALGGTIADIGALGGGAAAAAAADATATTAAAGAIGAGAAGLGGVAGAGGVTSGLLGAAGAIGSTLLTKALTPKISLPAPATPPATPTPFSAATQAAGGNVYAQAAQTAGRASTILTSGQGAALAPSNLQQKVLLGS